MNKIKIDVDIKDIHNNDVVLEVFRNGKLINQTNLQQNDLLDFGTIIMLSVAGGYVEIMKNFTYHLQESRFSYDKEGLTHQIIF